jgi:hypothetical protein
MEKQVKKLESLLDSIWRAGDKDEMSIKHIGHALAALIAHNDWASGDDYQTPDAYFDKDGNLDLEKMGSLLQKIKAYWLEVQQMKDELGLTNFVEIVKSSKFGYYPIDYLETDWLSYKAQYDKLVSV